jgi:hypothetical protein
MKLTIEFAENGFIVGVEENSYSYFFVALSINEVADIVKDILSVEMNGVDMSNVAFEPVPNGN